MQTLSRMGPALNDQLIGSGNGIMINKEKLAMGFLHNIGGTIGWSQQLAWNFNLPNR